MKEQVIVFTLIFKSFGQQNLMKSTLKLCHVIKTFVDFSEFLELRKNLPQINRPPWVLFELYYNDWRDFDPFEIGYSHTER